MKDAYRRRGVIGGREGGDGRVAGVKNWVVNGCLVDTRLNERGVSDRGFQELRDMLISVCMERTVPDCEFFLNLRESPVLRKDGRDPREALFGKEAPELPRK